MARSKRTGIELTAYYDLFETDESRTEANLSKIMEIPISEIVKAVQTDSFFCQKISQQLSTRERTGGNDEDS